MAGRQDTESMRRFWDERARQNAAWFVDTSIDYDNPDMSRFWDTGKVVVAEALDHSPVAPAGRELAVEIGSGLGRICLALADRFDRVVGIDISDEMVRRARELVDNPRVSFSVGDGASLQPVADASADLVLSFTVFQHIPARRVIESYIAEAGRILRPGGVMIFQWSSESGAGWPARRWVLATLQRAGIKGDPYGRNAREFLGSRIPVDTMRRSLRRAGLELQATRNEGSLFTWAWASKPGQPRA